MVSGARIGGRAGNCSGLNEDTSRGEVHIQMKGIGKNESPRHSAETRRHSASSAYSTDTAGSSRSTVDTDGGAQPTSPDVPLMSPEAARERTKRELVEYLLKAAPNEFLVESGIRGSVKNIMKVRSWDELVEAVVITWHARQGTCLGGASQDFWGNGRGSYLRRDRHRSDTFNVYNSKDELVQAGLVSAGSETNGNGPLKSTPVKNLIDFAACNVPDDDDSADDPFCAHSEVQRTAGPEANGDSPCKSIVKNLIDFAACNFCEA